MRFESVCILEGAVAVKKVMLVFGTRPEAIKMCPLGNELKSRENIQTIICVTGQHRQMLDQVLDTFQIVPDYDLSIMKQGQDLFDITANILSGIKAVLHKEKPDVVSKNASMKEVSVPPKIYGKQPNTEKTIQTIVTMK